MRTLWIFGDSYSESWKGVLMRTESYPQVQYCKHLDRIPHHFAETFTKIINSNKGPKIDQVKNYALGGFDNYTILQTISYHIREIKKDDIVLVGWSSIARWRFIVEENSKRENGPWMRENHPSFDPSWLPASPSFGKEEESDKKMHPFIEKQTVRRMCYATLKEISDWQNLLKLVLPKDTVFWTPFSYQHFRDFYPNEDWWDYKSLPFESIQYWTEEGKASSTEVAYAYGTPERIDEATKGEIDDRHYSEKGHLSIGKRLAVILSSQNGGEYFTKKSLF